MYKHFQRVRKTLQKIDVTPSQFINKSAIVLEAYQSKDGVN